jgi:hypothetical protein
MSVGVLRLTGRLGFEPLLLAAIAVAIWFGVVKLKPFTVVFA